MSLPGEIHVRRGGLSTTIQDLGRFHTRHLGVAVGGAMDRVSHELANRLVGNQPNAATLEMTLSGDELEWTFDAVIAITGADMSPIATLRGEAIERRVPTHRPVRIPRGTTIRFQTARRGCRCYLAIAGGFNVPSVLGSRSTLIRAEFGGQHGRKLQQGDRLSVAESDHVQLETPVAPSDIEFPSWFVRPLDLPSGRNDAECSVRIVTGSHHQHLSDESKQLFLNSPFVVSAASDRMGYRLTGAALTLNQSVEMQSEGTTVGTIQLPPDGHPIVLMSDSAPTGGYPRIAHVISADHAIMAQLRPGQKVRFGLVTLNDARMALWQQRQDLERAMLMASLLERTWC